MRAMAFAFIAMTVIAVGADVILSHSGFSAEVLNSSPAVRLSQ